MKIALAFYIFLASIFVIIPIQSYSESTDYVFVGNGYGILGDAVQDAMIELALKSNDGMMIFQNGQLLLGNKHHSIKNLDMSFSKNGKLLQINAVTDDGIAIMAKGKFVASNEGGSIYQITGQASKENNSQKLLLTTIFTSAKTILQTSSDDKQDILLLVEHYGRVEWKSPYKFVVRTFDPQSNPESNFHMTSGYLEGIKIHATITDPLGNILKVSDGVTKKFGYYEDTVIISDNTRTGNYVLNVTASGGNFNTTTKELTFLVIPLLPPPTATP